LKILEEVDTLIEEINSKIEGTLEELKEEKMSKLKNNDDSNEDLTRKYGEIKRLYNHNEDFFKNVKNVKRCLQ
jgi:NurA-like 5'-3' nuclease